MTLEIVIPEIETKNKTVKDMIFSILIEDKPKSPKNLTFHFLDYQKVFLKSALGKSY